jgi:hypothetical protein
MAIKRKIVLPLALAVGALGLMAVSQVASGAHVHPRGATPVFVSLAPSFKACSTPNDSHLGGLAYPSCNPPIQSSNFLTVGTPDNNAAGANSIGSILLRAIPGNVAINANITDVRCLPGESACDTVNPNAADGPDYTGQLQAVIGLRITDHYNSPAATPTTATTIDFSFPVPLNCGTTLPFTGNPPGQTIGSTCRVATTMNAIMAGMGLPNAVLAGNRTVFEIPQRTAPGGIQVFDGGALGVAGASDATLYMEPAVFVP